MRQIWQFGLDSMFREYTYMYVCISALNVSIWGDKKPDIVPLHKNTPPPFPHLLTPFVSPSFQCSNWPILLFLSTWLSFPSPLKLLNGALLRATETSLYVTSVKVNGHKVGVESHKTEMSQNKECFKRRGVQNVYVFFQKCFYNNLYNFIM